MWHKDAITPGELEALREAAARAWGEDTRYSNWNGHRGLGAGQCWVTARWLVERLGGYVGRKRGHYAWISPDGSHVIDLTGDHGGSIVYGRDSGWIPVEQIDNERSARFIKRANRIFGNLDRLLKEADSWWGGDALPGEEPQRADDIDQQRSDNLPYWHDEPAAEPSQGEYRFIYGNGQLEVSPIHDHAELAGHAGISDNHLGPIAAGHVIVNMGKATWEVDSNVNVKALERVFKDYCKQVGWQWGGLTNGEGEPIHDDFAPKRTSMLRYAYAERDGGILLGHTTHSDLLLHRSADDSDAQLGWIWTVGQRAYIFPIHMAAVPALTEWAEDAGLKLYAGNDNLLKTVPDLESDNIYSPNPAQDPTDEQNDSLFGNEPDERQPSGVYKCPACERLFPRWKEYQKHRKNDHLWGNDEPIEDGHFPDISTDDSPFPAHFTEMQPYTMPVASVKEAARVDGFEEDDADYYIVAYLAGSPVGYASIRDGRLARLHEAVVGVKPYILAKLVRITERQPKDLIEGPVPFIYDYNQDSVTVGEQGTRTSDIPGRFTPGGIVEGTYEPGGKIVLRTMTNVPISVYHLVELWYWQHPELEVKSVFMQDDAGGMTKLAEEQQDVGRQLATATAKDPAADAASKALFRAGGRVFVVGGAVRDALLGKDPKDVDLMVTGLPAQEVHNTLATLPGEVKLTGEDFAVLRYRTQEGQEVEVALPRRERSTGSGHKDFEVQSDHTMTPEEDLYRRDFTANALAVDLSNGQLIDPYHGAKDIADGQLRTIHDNSLAEDPLRVVRALVANSRHGLHPDDVTRAQMTDNAPSLNHLPAERIRGELDKLFAGENPANAIRLAQETGVLQHIFPEVAQAFGYNQNNPHHELELGDHLVSVLDRIATQTDDPDLRLAGLLHDIGKPASRWDECVNCTTDSGSRHVVPNQYAGACPDCGSGTSGHYYEYRSPSGVFGADHEVVGARLAQQRLDALRYPKDRSTRIAELIQHHMFPGFTSQKGARRFLNRVGDHADDLLALRWADQGGKSVYPTDPTLSIDQQAKLIDQVRNEGQPTNTSALAINGNDLIQQGIPQGPQIGQVLNQLTNAVVDDPGLNNRETLLNMAQNLLNYES